MTDPIDGMLALLFVSDAPAPLSELAAALGLADGQAEQILEVLERRLADRGPIQLTRLAHGYQLSTKPEFQEIVTNYLRPQRPKMSRSLLEILAIIAYRQPVTCGDIDAVRGVQSERGIRSLLERRLIKDVGRRQSVGRPILYSTTEQFLHTFNLADLAGLPSIEELGEPR